MQVHEKIHNHLVNAGDVHWSTQIQTIWNTESNGLTMIVVVISTSQVQVQEIQEIQEMLIKIQEIQVQFLF